MCLSLMSDSFGSLFHIFTSLRFRCSAVSPVGAQPVIYILQLNIILTFCVSTLLLNNEWQTVHELLAQCMSVFYLSSWKQMNCII